MLRCLLSLAWPERLTLASALAMLLLSWSAESQQALQTQTNPPTTAAALEVQRIRQIILGVMESIDARRWQALRAQFADSVLVDYTSLFGGYPRNYAVVDLIDNWRQLLAPFSMTRHDLGPIDVEIDADEAKAKCPVHIYHFLHGAPGGEEWVVNGEYMVTLKRPYERWQIQKIVLDVRSQEGNTNLLVQAFAPADGR